MLEEEYNLEYFRAEGLTRKICKSCGSAFWTRDPSRELCGDAPCEPYSFIGQPVFNPHSLDEMREKFLNFFEQNGHTRIGRYPVAARWRDDIYLTIASIADFQPFVTSGQVPPPANPLTISQPCIRLNDLDSVGRSGRHLTTFEMMAHHAFNRPDEEIYWKDRTVELCDNFLHSIGGDLNAVTYKEHPWIGGGNAGPSVEVIISGLEVATLVFMSMGKTPTAHKPVDLEGVPYYPMDLRIVDTGYGLERLVWASKGSPTVYDAVFPEMVSRLMTSSGLEHLLDNPSCTKVLGMNAKFAGLMDVTGSNLITMRKQVAKQIKVPFSELQSMIEPIEKVYSIADHSRCLSYMLGDCIVPSNVQEGYLARLVIRRMLRMMNELEMDEDPADLIELQMKKIGMESFEQDFSVVREIIDNEVEKYSQTMQRGARIIRKMADEYKKSAEPIPLKELITLYDSHGIPPEIVRDKAMERDVEVELPDNFYSLIADVHSESSPEKNDSDPFEGVRSRISSLPLTKSLYYDNPDLMEFDAIVLDLFDDFIVLDQTCFYPEGGGQPADTGELIADEAMVRITNVIKIGDVILHQAVGKGLKRGDRVKGIINEEKRLALMRHHTATHVLLNAAREVLGRHIHQAGARKGVESSRLDIRHYRHITPEELRKIECAANRMVLEDETVHTGIEDRVLAEQKYGFDLYQGGVPPGKEIRIVRVGSDVQACAGTHCQSTGEIGSIKIIRVEHIQDGIERLEFAAGLAAVVYIQKIEGLIDKSSSILSVQRENLPVTVERFFTEWKDQKKTIERIQKKMVEMEMEHLPSEIINGVEVTIYATDATPKEMVAIATGAANKGGVALIAGGSGRIHVVVASGTEKVNAGHIVRTVCEKIGGKGGGKPTLAQGSGEDQDSLEEALSVAREEIDGMLS